MIEIELFVTLLELLCNSIFPTTTTTTATTKRKNINTSFVTVGCSENDYIFEHINAIGSILFFFIINRLVLQNEDFNLTGFFVLHYFDAKFLINEANQE